MSNMSGGEALVASLINAKMFAGQTQPAWIMPQDGLIDS